MPGKLKIELDLETVRALRMALNGGAGGGPALSGNLIAGAAAAAVASCDGAVRPGDVSAGRVRGGEDEGPAARRPSQPPAAREDPEALPPVYPASSPAADYPRGRRVSAVGDGSPAGADPAPGGTTVINNFTNYYAVPAQRRSDAPSEWADGMVGT